MAARANASTAQTSPTATPQRRGHWSDRLPGIDKDIAAMQGKLQTPPTQAGADTIVGAIRSAAGKPNRPSVRCMHAPSTSFRPGQPLSLSLVVPGITAHDAPIQSISTTGTSTKENVGWPRKCNAATTDTVPPFQGTTPIPSTRCNTTLSCSGETMQRGSIQRSTPRFPTSLTTRSQRVVDLTTQVYTKIRR